MTPLDLNHLRAVAKAKMDQPRIDCPGYQNDAAFQMSLFAGDVLQLIERVELYDECDKANLELSHESLKLKAENERLRKQLEATTAIAQMRGNAAGAAESRLAIAVEALEFLDGRTEVEIRAAALNARTALATLASKDGEG